MASRVVKIGGVVLDLLGYLTRPGTLKLGNFQSHLLGQFSAYTGMWAVNLAPAQTANLKATSSVRVYPTFPRGTVFTWDVTPDPNWTGVNGFLSLAYGNYDDSPSSITPRKVNTITDLTLTVGWSFRGNASTGLLCECWLSPASTATGPITKTAEVGFWPKVSPQAASFAAGTVAVGSGSFTDTHGAVWLVRQDTSLAQPYYFAYRPGYASHQGPLHFKDLFAFLTTAGKITGNEWFNGLAFGPEPRSGSGSLVISEFIPSYS